MAITLLLSYFSCALILSRLDAKSISLNELIASEKIYSHPHQKISTIPETLTPPKVPSLFEIPFSTKDKKRGESSKLDTRTKHGKNRLVLNYRKTSPLKSSQKPKKFKFLLKPDYKLKNLSIKRELPRRHVKINQKYLPLLRNIELLFDNILSSDSRETYESRRDQFERSHIADKKDNICTCSTEENSEDSYPQEETVTTTSYPSYEIEDSSSAVTTAAQTDNIVYDNISRFRRNKNIPILFARNPTSFRRNYTRLSERSSPTYIRRSEGYIAGDNGTSKRSAVKRGDASFSKDNVKNSNSNTRDNANSIRFTDGIRGFRTNIQTAEVNREADESTTLILPSNETPTNVTRNISENKEQIKFQVRGIETESPVFLSEPASGQRDYEPQKENIPTRSTEGYEKSIPNNISNDKSIIVRNGQIASENKKSRRTNEAVGPKVVMIFDGYSVARDVNGENKMTEKAIHIHS